MGDIFGGRAKFTNIPVPTGKKITGKVVEVKLSEKIDDYISINVEFPQYKKRSTDGKKDFVKRSFFGIPVDWSPKNKAGRLYQALYGHLPKDDEQVNWTRILLGREVACIFESVIDDVTGEPKGDKISWMGAVGATPVQAKEEEREIQMGPEDPEFPDGDDLPPHIEPREPGDEEHIP